MPPVESAHVRHDTVIEYDEGRSEEETEDAMDESREPLDESRGTHGDSSDEEVEDAVAEDILRFEQSFKNITQRYRLINRIGEGRPRTRFDLPLPWF